MWITNVWSNIWAFLGSRWEIRESSLPTVFRWWDIRETQIGSLKWSDPSHWEDVCVQLLLIERMKCLSCSKGNLERLLVVWTHIQKRSPNSLSRTKFWIWTARNFPRRVGFEIFVRPSAWLIDWQNWCCFSGLNFITVSNFMGPDQKIELYSTWWGFFSDFKS
jgi:hypothetical protein